MMFRTDGESLESYLRTIISCARESKVHSSAALVNPVFKPLEPALVLQTPLPQTEQRI